MSLEKKLLFPVNENTLFHIKNIKKKFRNKETITYQGDEMIVKRGCFTFITGDSGVGKSTLLHILALLEADISPSEKDNSRLTFYMPLAEYYTEHSAPIVGIDLKGKVIDWNKAAEKITGLKKKKVIGKNLAHISQDHKPSIRDVMDQVSQGERTLNFEFSIYVKKGRKLKVKTNLITNRNNGGDISGIIGIFQYVAHEKNILSGIGRNEAAHIRRSFFGILPQQGHLIHTLSSTQNLEISCRLKSSDNSNGIQVQIENAIKRVGLPDFISNGSNKAKFSPAYFSGGESQRLALARTILYSPKVIFVDEPTTYMSKDLVQTAMEVLSEEVINNGSSVIVVSHQINDMFTYLSNIIDKKDKRIEIVWYELKEINTESSESEGKKNRCVEIKPKDFKKYVEQLQCKTIAEMLCQS